MITAGPTFFNCVAVSTTPDATGSYFRYAFPTGLNFPDHPKYGVWPNAYFLATRQFAPDDSCAGIGTYALERNKMLDGNPNTRSWSAHPTAAFFQSAQIPVAEFDTALPCIPPGSRNCIPQPDTNQRIDSPTVRQRPIWRLACRNFGDHPMTASTAGWAAPPWTTTATWRSATASPARPSSRASASPGGGPDRLVPPTRLQVAGAAPRSRW